MTGVALLTPAEIAAHGWVLVVDKGGLALERGIVFHFHRLFGGIGVQRFREVGLDPSLPAAKFGELFRSEEHTSELQSLMRISYAVFCLKKKNKNKRLINLLPTVTNIISIV